MQEIVSVVGGTSFAEDFNYGDFYTDRMLPTEFDYSSAVLTNDGVLTPLRSGEYSVQHLNQALDVRNYDRGLHGGYLTQANYFMFPIMTWNSVEGITTELEVYKAGTLSFDYSFDGHFQDVFYFVIDNIQVFSVTSTQGYYWQNATIDLAVGKHTISWLLHTSSRPTGDPQSILLRYFRISDIRAGFVATLPIINQNVIDIKTEFTASALSYVVRVQPSVAFNSEFMLSDVHTVYADAVAFETVTTVTAPPTISVVSVIAIVYMETIDVIDGAVVEHNFADGGFYIACSGDLSVSFPLNTVFDIESLIRPLRKTTIVMETPVIIAGQPVKPQFSGIQTVRAISNGNQTLNAPVPPTSILHIYPPEVPVPTQRYLATAATYDATTEDLLTWPSSDGGSVWSGVDNYRPKVRDYTYGSDQNKVPTKVVHFDATELDVISITLANSLGMTSVAGQYGMTWMVCGIFYAPPFSMTPILDFKCTIDWRANRVPAVTYWEESIDGFYDPVESTQSAFLGLTNGYLATHRQRVTPTGQNQLLPMGQLWGIPCVVYCCYAPPCYGGVVLPGYENSMDFVREAIDGSAADTRSFTLGKSRIPNGLDNTATMTIFEVAYWNHRIEPDQVLAAARNLCSIYQFGRSNQ